MAKIFVNYIVQNDQWESINEPNLYVLPGTYSNLNLITAGLIYDTFPIKDQRFYLRFFLDDKIQDLKVWMDYPLEATVPVYTDKIFVKALRLPKKADSIDYKGSEMFKRKEGTSKKVEKDIIKNTEKVENKSSTNNTNKNNSNSGNTYNNNMYEIFKNDGNKNIENEVKDSSINDKNQKILDSFEFKNIFTNNQNNSGNNTANVFIDANTEDFQFSNTNTNTNNNNSNNEIKYNIFENNSKNNENNKANSESNINANMFYFGKDSGTLNENDKKNNNNSKKNNNGKPFFIYRIQRFKWFRKYF